MTRKIELDIDKIVELYMSGKTCREIGSHFGVSDTTIWQRLKSYGAPIRRGSNCHPSPVGIKIASETYRNPQWLYHQYHNVGKSQQEIANEIGIPRTVIQKAMTKFDITTRSRHENALPGVRHFQLTEEVIASINGLLLGDGSIGEGSSVATRYTHSDKHLHFIEDLKNRFLSFGIQTQAKIRTRHGVTKGHKFTAYSLTTLNYAELLPFREKWYPNGKKTLPDNIELTPTTCLYWHLGDGGLKNSPWRTSMTLSTHCFMKKDVLRLIDKLEKLEMSASYWPSRNCIGIGANDTPKFLEYIGPCPEEIWQCYGYKWDLTRSKKEWEAEFALT